MLSREGASGTDASAEATPVRVVIRADGAARGNPGPAAAGAVLIDTSGPAPDDPDAAPLAVISRPLGIATNNVAEYTAVLLALEKAESLGAAEVELILDSLLVVEQLSGRWKVKEPRLRVLRDDVVARLARFRSWTIRHEPRVMNRAADALANLALDDPAAAAVLDARERPESAARLDTPRPTPSMAALAVLPSDEVHNEVRRMQYEVLQQLGATPARRAAVLTFTPHITLKQPFEVSEVEVYERYLDVLARSVTPFQLVLRGLGSFDGPEGILSLDVQPDPGLVELRERVVRELADLGVKPDPIEIGDPAPYRFHMTLGYGLDGEALAAARRVLREPPELRFTLERLALFLSVGAERVRDWFVYRQVVVGGGRTAAPTERPFG